MAEEAIHVWFCSPDHSFTEVIARTLGQEYSVERSQQFTSGELRRDDAWADVVLLDLRHVTGQPTIEEELRLMDEIKQADPTVPIIAIVEDGECKITQMVLENGAYDTLASPPDMAELRVLLRRASRNHQVEKELVELRSRDQDSGRLGEMIGFTESMQPTREMARKVAACDVTVLVTGETGTGKELLARAIHRMSSRASGPFIAFSCADLPETLVEDELFGHERGAFTGAIGARRGRFEVANGGTLFLDEIGDLPLGLQPKLLRVLQQRSFERLGSSTTLTTNVRVVCATHRNLEEMVAQGKFRSDLYYRLNVVQLHLPPLRERREAIPVLCQHFLRRFAEQFGKSTKKISPLAMHAMEEYAWLGNVRELENVVQRAVVLAEGATVELWHLPEKMRIGFEQILAGHSYEDEVRDFKRRLILRTLRECGGRKAEAARALGVARGYLHRLINQLRIPSDLEGWPMQLPAEGPSERVM